MKRLVNCLYLLAFIIILFTGCNKDNVHVLETRSLFSVDLDNQKFNLDYQEAYIAAYTSDGKLLNYGNLSDSSKWTLKAKCKEDKIDILYFEIWRKSSLFIHHVKNVNPGHLFEDNSRLEFPRAIQDLRITLKVEDFGNSGNNTTPYILYPREFHRGYPYTGEFGWKNIKDGYTYKNSWIDLDPKYQDAELLIFERGTNIPLVHHLKISPTSLNPNDTITLHKSDFTPGVAKTIQVIPNDKGIKTMRLYTYNTSDGKKDLITSYDQYYDQSCQNSSGKYCINYIVSDILPINYWKFSYSTLSPLSTYYHIRSNAKIPTSLEIQGLTNYSITKTGSQFNLTHATTIPDKNIVRSTIQFSKKAFSYYLYFDKNESTGTTSIAPFEIPIEILDKYSAFSEANSLEWKANSYSQTYTTIPKNSPLDYLENSLLKWTDNDSSSKEYSYEEFRVEL